MEKSFLRRLRRVVFLNLFNLLFSRSTRNIKLKRLILRLACIRVGKNTTVVGPLILGNSVKFSVGEGSWCGQDFKVYGSGEAEIGNNVAIGPDVTILSGSHQIGGAEQRAGTGLHYHLIIGNGVWIGGRSTLYGNIRIDDSSIVGAGSLVNKDVTKNTIVGGVPSRVLREL